ncbi:MAG: hypothetical protein AB7G13_06805 [Lautropia sp.]
MIQPSQLRVRRGHARSSPSQFSRDELDWIERHGIENLLGRAKTADTLAKEASLTLSLTLAGTVGALAYAVKVFSGELTYANVGFGCASVWLMAVSMFLVFGCLRVSAMPPIYNEPGKLLSRVDSGASFEQWRIGELHNIDDRIRKAAHRNRGVANRLNTARALAAMTPLVSSAALWILCGEVGLLCR